MVELLARLPVACPDLPEIQNPSGPFHERLFRERVPYGIRREGGPPDVLAEFGRGIPSHGDGNEILLSVVVVQSPEQPDHGTSLLVRVKIFQNTVRINIVDILVPRHVVNQIAGSLSPVTTDKMILVDLHRMA